MDFEAIICDLVYSVVNSELVGLYFFFFLIFRVSIFELKFVKPLKIKLFNSCNAKTLLLSQAGWCILAV